MNKMAITKDDWHDHFWIEDGVLGETYKTIRGLRYRFRCYVDYPDRDKVSDEELIEVEKCIIDK